MAIYYNGRRSHSGQSYSGRSHHQRLTTFGLGLAIMVAVTVPTAAQTLNLQSGDTISVSATGT